MHPNGIFSVAIDLCLKVSSKVKLLSDSHSRCSIHLYSKEFYFEIYRHFTVTMTNKMEGLTIYNPIDYLTDIYIYLYLYLFIFVLLYYISLSFCLISFFFIPFFERISIN